MKRQARWYVLAVGCAVMLVACVSVPQLTLTPSPMGPLRVVSPTATTTLERVPMPTLTALPTMLSTLYVPFATSTILPLMPAAPKSTPSPISVTSIPTQALPTVVRMTSAPVTPRSTLNPPRSTPLIPPSPPRVYETSAAILTYDYERALEPSGKDDPIYPYPHLNFDKVGLPTPRNYRAIILENSYTQVTILPELGGRIWRIVDKTTGRAVTYQNPVIKPTQWGYRGWWLATGGIEWCLPVDEHGLNEYRPWSATVSGASVTVSDHEDRTGLDVAVTISLDSAHSYVTIQPRVTNSTGAPQRMQFWLNAMLALNGNRATDSTRFILPAAQVMLHSSDDNGLPNPGSKIDWPVFKGRDLSRYASWRGYLGFFASPSASADFVGAYDPSSDQGIVRVFPSGVARGVKFFGGKGIDPAIWTNDGSTYFELWGGLLPTFWDYTTIQPGQTFGWTERWYPVSGLGQGFEAANATAAMRLSIQSDAASVGAMSSVNLTGLVKLWQNGQVAATWPVTIGPGHAFNAIQPITSPALGLQLIDPSGNVLAQTGSVP